MVQSISVLDRSTGRQLGRTSNADAQIASESIMKLLLAAYYLVLYGGYSKTPADVRARLSYMLRYSDDATASALFTANAIPTVAARYGLSRTTNATDRAGHWGAARITAREMTVFLYKASKDSAVGPWLIPVMAQTAASGSDGFNQKFGLNALSGTHGSKQGWGADSYWTSQPYAIHSVGYTSRYFVAVLQIGPANTYADPMRGLATSGAKLIQASGSVLSDGTFVRVSGHTNIYRIAGGAPVYRASWTPWGKRLPVVDISQAQFDSLLTFPADGTFVRAAPSGNIYRIVGGSALFVGSWRAVGGEHPAMWVDGAAIRHAGESAVYAHLRAEPLDGTFIRASGKNRVYRIVGDAPVYVSSWANIGGQKCTIDVDPLAVTQAGNHWWHNLSMRPRSGTYIRAWSTNRVYKMAGGAPIYVPSWASLGTSAQPTVAVDATAISNGGHSGEWAHLRYYPSDGTFLRGATTNRIYRVSAGVAHRVTSWTRYGGVQPTTWVPQVSIDRAGTGGSYDHLRKP